MSDTSVGNSKSPPRRPARAIAKLVVLALLAFVGYTTFFPSPKVRALRRIRELGGYTGSTSRAVFPFNLLGLTQLTIFSRQLLPSDVVGVVVEGKAVADADVAQLCAAFPMAEQVDFSSTPVSAEGFLPLAGLARLSQIAVRHTEADDRLLASLNSNQLHVLDLAGTRVTDAGIARFLSSRTVLSQSYLNGTSVTDNTCIELAKLKQLSQVDLSSTRVTKAGVEQLQAAHPNCNIIWQESEQQADTR
jgi:hypothetical protein